MNQQLLSLIALALLVPTLLAYTIHDKETPPPPDYASLDYWAAHYEKEDRADLLPEKSGLTDNQKEAQVDAFFLHPTTLTSDKDTRWNGDVTDKELNESTDKTTIKHQASIFNGSCRVYAPRYRQAHLRSYFSKGQEKEARAAFELAYSDVKKAFEYYLENINDGRPIIIASHSQGTTHAKRLLQDFFDGKELQKQLVAAYVVGMPIRSSEFEVLTPCTNPEETGCYNTWCTYSWNSESTPYYKGAVVTNPINWTIDGEYASRKQSKGLVWRQFKKVQAKKMDAQSKDGILCAHKPAFFEALFAGKNLHIADYNLFYLDVRNNVAERVKAFLAKK
ncbi:MAG: DUF3089 domain-containing protein [Aureispira sp.]|nr:DUF3089 domain-containing protein [Aureispira sp.]